MAEKKKFNLTLEEAIERLSEQAERNTIQTEQGNVTDQLQGMTVDEAYDVGYATLLHDLKSLTGPDPLEVELHALSPVNFPEVEDFHLLTEKDPYA